MTRFELQPLNSLDMRGIRSRASVPLDSAPA